VALAMPLVTLVNSVVPRIQQADAARSAPAPSSASSAGSVGGAAARPAPLPASRLARLTTATVRNRMLEYNVSEDAIDRVEAALAAEDVPVALAAGMDDAELLSIGMTKRGDRLAFAKAVKDILAAESE